MHVRNTKSLKLWTLVDYQHDGASLYMLVIGKTVRLLSLSDSFDLLTNAVIESPVHVISKPCIDESFVYISTKTGHILALDKYSGELVQSIDLGSMMIMSDLCQDSDYVYCMAGLPISNGSAISSENYCLNVLSKSSGKKEFQGQCFQAVPNFLSVDDAVWCIAGDELHQYSKSGSLESVVSLSFPPSYSPIVSDSYVICASQNGSLEIFDKVSLKRHNNLMLAKNNSPPLVRGDHLYWFVESGVVSIALKESRVEMLGVLGRSIISTPALLNNVLYGCNMVGELVQFDLELRSSSVLKLSDYPLWKPVISEGFVFVASKKNLFQVEA